MSEGLRVVLAIVLAIAGLAAVGFGVWLTAHGSLPTWMKGIWKWPMGDNVTPSIARMMGLASLLAAAACPPAIVLLVVWNRDSGGWLSMMAAMFFVGASTFATFWSIAASRIEPA